MHVKQQIFENANQEADSTQSLLPQGLGNMYTDFALLQDRN